MPNPKRAAVPDRPITDRAKLDAVMSAIREYECSRSLAWMAIEEIEVAPVRIFETEREGFSAMGTAYVSPPVDCDEEEDNVGLPVPIQLKGRFVNEDGEIAAIVDSLEVDTPSAPR